MYKQILNYLTGKNAIGEDSSKAARMGSKFINYGATFGDILGIGVMLSGYQRNGVDLIIFSEALRNVSNWITRQ